ncbi:hypothetical protein MBLNU13_g08747t1 [Cladosporium sp. NU13]
MYAEMDRTQTPPGTEDCAPLYMPGSPSRRQRLRAVAAGGENLYEPPNTAEAFARLEAAIDEVKFHGSMSEGQGLIARRRRLKEIVATYQDLYEPPDTAEAFARLEAAIDEVKSHALASGKDSGEDQMLDPPTTAERFNRIETAIGEVLAGHTISTETPRWAKSSTSNPHQSTEGADTDHKEAAHFQLRRADQSESTRSTHSMDKPTKTPGSPGLKRKPHGYFSRCGSLRLRSEIYKPGNSYGPTSAEVALNTQGAVDLPISEGEGAGTSRDVDVFRDDDSVKAFANQTYQSVREKYL